MIKEIKVVVQSNRWLIDIGALCHVYYEHVMLKKYIKVKVAKVMLEDAHTNNIIENGDFEVKLTY